MDQTSTSYKLVYLSRILLFRLRAPIISYYIDTLAVLMYRYVKWMQKTKITQPVLLNFKFLKQENFI